MVALYSCMHVIKSVDIILAIPTPCIATIHAVRIPLNSPLADSYKNTGTFTPLSQLVQSSQILVASHVNDI